MAYQGSNWDTASNRHAESALQSPGAIDAMAGEDTEGEAVTDAQWLQRCSAAYNSSTDWFNSALRDQWERNWRAFNNQHPNGSKYHSEAFKHRSKLYRPKTRAAMRKAEAACATAFFSTQDMVSIEPGNDADETQLASARVNEELLNHRLDGKPIRWFMSVMGAFQDTMVSGICCSYQYWHYEERIAGYEEVPVLDETGMPVLNDDGAMATEIEAQIEVVYDEPRCELIAPENIRIAPAADWLDPIKTSPYVIRRIPMYVIDVKQRMGARDPKTGQPQWRHLDDTKIQRGRDPDYNSTRQARQEYRRDAHQEESSTVRDYDIVWVHENILRYDGEDWCFYSLGVHDLLTDPKPLQEVYWHGERPYVMGCCVLEAHKPYPASKVQLTQDLQAEANEVANQRLDNVRLAMNPRYLYKQGADVDVAALARSVPGGPVSVGGRGSIAEQIHIDRPPDVTASAYAEQDRINLDFDEMAGAFSSSSVQSNRRMNETVGGMNLLSNSASTMQDYELRVFAETWVQPVLNQLVKLEQAYETDETVLAIAGRKAQLYERYGIADLDEGLLRQDMEVRVNVGIGNTDPAQKLQRFQTAASVVGGIFGEQAAQKADFEAVIEEVFGVLGYKDGRRFFKLDQEEGEDPRIEEMQQQMQQMQQALETEQVKAEQRMAEQQIRAEVEREKLQARLEEQRLRGKVELTKQQMADDNAITRAAMQSDEHLSTEEMRIALKVQELMQRSQSDAARQASQSMQAMTAQTQGGPQR